MCWNTKGQVGDSHSGKEKMDPEMLLSLFKCLPSGTDGLSRLENMITKIVTAIMKLKVYIYIKFLEKSDVLA